MPRPKYDLFLNNKPLQLKTYNKSSTDDIVSRFGSSEKGETNLDMLKAETQKSFAGGMFQRIFDDPEKVSTIQGAYYNEQDKKLYFAPDADTAGYHQSITIGDEITASCIGDAKVWFAVRQSFPVPGFPIPINRLFVWYETDGLVYEITLPAALRDAGSPITSMVWHLNQPFIACQSVKQTTPFWQGSDVYRLDNIGGNGTSTTFVSIKTGFARRLLASFRGKLYGIGAASLSLITNEFGAANTAVETVIKQVGIYYPWTDTVQFMVVFNGALWIGKVDGLFRFDGVDVVCVIDFSSSQRYTNFSLGEVWNGRLYYTIGNKVYRFDGTNIELIADFGSVALKITDLSAGNDRLIITTQYNDGTPASDGGKAGYTGGGLYTWYAYSGFGVYEIYSAASIFAELGMRAGAVTGLGRQFFLYGTGYYNGSLEIRYSSFFSDSYRLDSEFTNKNRQKSMTIISSEYNNGYPSVDKMLSGFSIDAQALNKLTEFTVSVRHEPDAFASPDEWSAWEVVYQAKNGDFPLDGLSHNVHDGVNDGVINIPSAAIRYKRLQVKVYAAVTSWTGITEVVRLRNFTTRYTLQPRQRFRWNIAADVVNYIAGIREQVDGEGKAIKRSAAEVRSIIYNSLRSKSPILFYDLERYKVETATTVGGNRVVTLFDVNLYDLRVGDVLAFSADGTTNWINRRILSIAAGSITLAPSGDRTALGGGAGTINVGDFVRISRLAYVSRILSEVIDPDQLSADAKDADGYDSVLSFELREL